jgi:hypothetical protein
LREVAHGNQQNAGLVFVFQCGFDVFCGELRVLAEPANDGLNGERWLPCRERVDIPFLIAACKYKWGF